MASAWLIPDRYRNHFPLNGGPRPNAGECAAGHNGIAAARAVLDATPVPPPSGPTVIKRLTPEQIVRARSGIAKARQALETDDH